MEPSPREITSFVPVESPRLSEPPRAFFPVLALAKKSLRWGAQVHEEPDVLDMRFSDEEEEKEEEICIEIVKEQRDKDARELAEIVLIEMECVSALDVCMSTRQLNKDQHELMSARLELYTTQLKCCSPSSDPKWNLVVEMVSVEIPRILKQVQGNLKINDVKIEIIQQQLKDLEARRKVLEERILVYESRMASQLDVQVVPTWTA